MRINNGAIVKERAIDRPPVNLSPKNNETSHDKNTTGSFNPLASQADIPLSRDSSTRLLPWIIGFMAYIASLALIGFIILSALIETWETSLNSTLTIQIPAENRLNIPLKERADAVMAILDKNPYVQTVERLDRNAVSLLLEPWLGMTSLPENLPVPELITIFMPQINDIDIQRLALQLKAIDPLISVDTHEVWRNQLLRVVKLATHCRLGGKRFVSRGSDRGTLPPVAVAFPA